MKIINTNFAQEDIKLLKSQFKVIYIAGIIITGVLFSLVYRKMTLKIDLDTCELHAYLLRESDTEQGESSACACIESFEHTHACKHVLHRYPSEGRLPAGL